MLFEYLLLQRSIKKLTINDFDFDIGTSKGTINPNEIKIIHTKKKLDNSIEYTVSVPRVNFFSVNDKGVLRSPTTREITLLDLTEYKKYKKTNDEYDCIEVEVFYINATLKNKMLFNKINNYIFLLNHRCAIRKDRIPYRFSYCNWNIPPFITEEKQFTEDDKQRLFNDIKVSLLQAII